MHGGVLPYPLDRRYGVTQCGRVFRIVRARFGKPVPYELAQTLNRHGYPCVGGGHKTGRGLRCTPVHLMVLRTFDPIQPLGTEAAHEDGNAGNPHLDNLSWKTSAANQADRLRHGTHNRGERQGAHKLTDDIVTRLRAGTLSLQEAALVGKTSVKYVRSVQQGRGWPHVPAR